MDLETCIETSLHMLQQSVQTLSNPFKPAGHVKLREFAHTPNLPSAVVTMCSGTFVLSRKLGNFVPGPKRDKHPL